MPDEEPVEQEGARPAPREEELRELLALGRALAAELRPASVLEQIVRTARTLTRARYAALAVAGEGGPAPAEFVSSGMDPEIQRRLGGPPAATGVLGLILHRRTVLRLQDLTTHPAFGGFPPGHPPMRAFLGAPILLGGQALGSLYLADPEHGGPFTDDDEQVITELTAFAAVALRNARRFEETEVRRRQAERAVRSAQAALDVAQVIGSETDLDRILDLIATRTRPLIAATTVAILLREGDALRVAARAGPDGPAVGAVVPVDGSAAGPVLDDGAPLRLLAAPDPVAEPVHAPHSTLIVPLEFRGTVLGVLSASDTSGGRAAFDVEDERTLRAVAASAATAVSAARTVAAQRLRDSVAGAELERRRWARELHDETLQGLGAVRLVLASALRADPDGAHELIAEAVGQVDREIAELRRIIADLRPAALDELGLEPALRSLAARIAERQGFAVDMTVALGPDRLAPELETVAYRVTQEALNNVARHAGARAVQVRATRTGGSLSVVVADDGVGPTGSADPGAGFGIPGMRERAALVGGSLTVEAGEHGGTVVRLHIPVGGPAV